MHRTSLKIAWRTLLKERAFTLLNILGLATGLACAILIWLWIADEGSVDKFHQNDSRLFQVLKNSPSPDGIQTSEPTPGLLAATLAREMPEVEFATAVVPPSWTDKKGILSHQDQPGQDRRITASSQFIGTDYFNLFSYALIEGDKSNILPDKYSIVLSDELALKLFNTTEHIVGRSVVWNQKDYDGSYRITGVFRKPPANSTAQFDLAFNYQLFLDKNDKLQNWENNDPNTYVLLKKGTDPRSFSAKIANLIKAKSENAASTLFLQKYSDKYLHNHYENGAPSGGRVEYVRLFSIIAIFILVIACINFMNLSTAKGAKRIKESGIRKMLGANRGTLIVQSLAESLFLTLISALIALVGVALLLPGFNQITGKDLHLSMDSHFVLAILTIVFVTGVLSGLYPALYLSGFTPALVLRGKFRSSISELITRKALVVFQFAISALFIISVLVVYKQMQFIQTRNLGYSRDHLLYFEKGDIRSADKKDPLSGASKDPLSGASYETGLNDFLQRVKNIPGVLNAANFRHNITNRDGGTYDLSWPGKDPNTRIDFTDLAVGFDFIETAGIEMKEGRSYSRSYGSDKSHIIFNEAAIKTMGLKDPIGKTVRIWGQDKTIVGVVKDFNFQSLHENLKPCFLDLTVNQWASKIMVKISAGTEKATIARLESLYKEYNAGLPFEYRFVDDDYQALYAAEKRVAALSKYFAGLAIVISCLGLFGLAAFTAQRRQKEIGIRKTIGASANNIVLLLSVDILKWISIALLIAFPLAAWLMHRWLQGFAYHVDMSIGIFLLAGFSTFLITLLSIGFQSVKAAMLNPIKALKTE